MIEKFNGIFYLAVFLIHFIGFVYYGFRCVFQTKSFLDQYGIDDTGAGMVRFFGSIFFGSVIMAIYVGFIRPNGLEATWGFLNLVFINNLCIFLCNFYSIKMNKTGVNEKTTNEGIIAPFVFTLMSAILIYGLSNKIYT